MKRGKKKYTTSELAEKIAEKAYKALGQVESVLKDGKEQDVGFVDTQRLRHLTQTVKDLKELSAGGEEETMKKLDEVLERILGEEGIVKRE